MRNTGDEECVDVCMCKWIHEKCCVLACHLGLGVYIGHVLDIWYDS